jgi:hypothetical protein
MVNEKRIGQCKPTGIEEIAFFPTGLPLDKEAASICGLQQ